MKLEKAIQIKENHQRIHPDEYYLELLDADNLSIEALKFVKRMRGQPHYLHTGLLQGETKD